MRMLGWIAVLGVAVLVGFGLWVRLAPSDPTVWHVDPLSEPGTGKPNAYRVLPEGMGTRPADAAAPVYPVEAAVLAAAFDAHVIAQPRTTLLAGGPDALWATYVQRSRVFGFPDYVSVRFLDLPEGGSTLAIYSRARFGTSDLGVNFARVQDWVGGLQPLARGSADG
jgi:uncharacterized protein (DUF1499 family)